jgi:hypothetical protein
MCASIGQFSVAVYSLSVGNLEDLLQVIWKAVKTAKAFLDDEDKERYSRHESGWWCLSELERDVRVQRACGISQATSG